MCRPVPAHGGQLPVGEQEGPCPARPLLREDPDSESWACVHPLPHAVGLASPHAASPGSQRQRCDLLSLSGPRLPSLLPGGKREVAESAQSIALTSTRSNGQAQSSDVGYHRLVLSPFPQRVQVYLVIIPTHFKTTLECPVLLEVKFKILKKTMTRTRSQMGHTSFFLNCAQVIGPGRPK